MFEFLRFRKGEATEGQGVEQLSPKAEAIKKTIDAYYQNEADITPERLNGAVQVLLEEEVTQLNNSGHVDVVNEIGDLSNKMFVERDLEKYLELVKQIPNNPDGIVRNPILAHIIELANHEEEEVEEEVA